MSRRPEVLVIGPKEALSSLRKFDSDLGPFEMLMELKNAFFPTTTYVDRFRSYELGLWSNVHLHINFLKSLGFTFCMLVDAVKADMETRAWLSTGPSNTPLPEMPSCICRYCSETKNASS